jgi:DNA-binding transcriptional regulator YiaG
MDNDLPKNILPTDSKFVRILKTVMWANKLSPLQFAKLLGISQEQVNNWLDGKSLPDYGAMQLLKDKLDVCIEHYFD